MEKNKSKSDKIIKLNNRTKEPLKTKDIQKMPEKDVRVFAKELLAYKTMLEMENEELIRICLGKEGMLKKYSTMNDLAPVGF